MLTRAMCRPPRESAIEINRPQEILGRGMKNAKGSIKANLKKLNKRGGNSPSPILLKVVFVPMIAIASRANKILGNGISNQYTVNRFYC